MIAAKRTTLLFLLCTVLGQFFFTTSTSAKVAPSKNPKDNGIVTTQITMNAPTAEGILRTVPLGQRKQLPVQPPVVVESKNTKVTSDVQPATTKDAFLRRNGKRLAIGAALGAAGLFAAHQIPRRHAKQNLWKKNTLKGTKYNLGARKEGPSVPFDGNDRLAPFVVGQENDYTKESYYAKLKDLPEALQYKYIRGPAGVALATLDTLEDYYFNMFASLIVPAQDHRFLHWNSEKGIAYALHHMFEVDAFLKYVQEARTRTKAVNDEAASDAKVFAEYAAQMIKRAADSLFRGDIYEAELLKSELANTANHVNHEISTSAHQAAEAVNKQAPVDSDHETESYILNDTAEAPSPSSSSSFSGFRLRNRRDTSPCSESYSIVGSGTDVV